MSNWICEFVRLVVLFILTLCLATTAPAGGPDQDGSRGAQVDPACTLTHSAWVRDKGEWYDAGINQSYMRNRQYEPAFGRFAQVDPARAGTNWYAFAGGDPVNNSDPSGLDYITKKGSDVFYWIFSRSRNDSPEGQAFDEDMRKSAGSNCGREGALPRWRPSTSSLPTQTEESGPPADRRKLPCHESAIDASVTTDADCGNP
jgi:RHS repeat-associated protein